MSKTIKIYMIFLVIIAFSCGITGVAMMLLTHLKMKGLLLTFAGFQVSHFINEAIMKHETIEEEYEY